MAFGYGRGIPQSARDVAAAFLEGRHCTRTNCRTDGRRYILVDTVIARRTPEQEQPDQAARAVLGLPYTRPLEFTFGGWPTEMTCRHLQALGLRAEIKRQPQWGPKGGRLRGKDIPVPTLNGVEVSCTAWYSPEQLQDMPKWVAAEPHTISVPAYRQATRQLELAL